MSDAFIAEILPRAASLHLHDAAVRAAKLPAESIERAIVVRDAIRSVQLDYPECFRETADPWGTPGLPLGTGK